jgi:SAM-dependent methyltransferase
MALQVVDHLDAVLAEMSRVLRPRGRVAVLLPASGPLGVTDARFYVRLQTTLRRRIEYPNDALLRAKHLRALAAEAGLAMTSDERQPFVLPLRSEADADELLASLYLPGIDPGRLAAGRDVVRSRARGEVTIPLRRVVFDRAVRR